MRAPDTITFAHIGKAMAKTIIVRDGRIVDTAPAPNSRLHHFRAVAVDGPDDLLAALEEAAGRGEIAVRGEPLAPTGRRAIYPDKETGAAPGLKVVPRRWVGLDWDNLSLDVILDPIPGIECDLLEDLIPGYKPWHPVDPLRDPETITRHALRRTPPAFRDVSCIWQISASAGFKPGGRLRTWHWLDHPTTGAELQTWLKPAIERHLVDPVTLREAQPHFLSVRAVGGSDPCPQRFGIFRQARDVVPVADIAGIKRRQDEREQRARAERFGNTPDRRHDPASARTYAERRIAECIEAIRCAPDGAKHPTFVQESARAKAICDRYGIAWDPVRRELQDTYVATLDPAEARRRWRGSVAGVLAWLDRRAAA